MYSNNRENSYFIFDIETIPDITMIRKLHPELFNGNSLISDEEVYRLFRESLKSKYNNDFLPTIYHKVFNIGYIMTDSDINPVFKGVISGDEEQVLNAFNGLRSRPEFIFVSFNGKYFDVPVLAQRSIVYGIDIKHLVAGGRWKNKITSDDKHIDLADRFKFGFGKKPSMKEISYMLNLNAKPDGVYGSDVYDLYLKKNYDIINKYVLDDADVTYELFLKYLNMTKYNLHLDISGFQNKLRLLNADIKILEEEKQCVV